MKSNVNKPFLTSAERYYRMTETSKLSIRLAETVGDILRSIDRFYEKNGIPMEEGMIRLIDEAGNLLKQISETQSLPLHELLERPPAWLPPENEQGSKSPEDRTEPFICL